MSDEFPSRVDVHHHLPILLYLLLICLTVEACNIDVGQIEDVVGTEIERVILGEQYDVRTD